MSTLRSSDDVESTAWWLNQDEFASVQENADNGH
jgi:hypothetical protein